MTFVRAFDRWRVLTGCEKRLLIEAAVLTLLCTARIRLVGAPRVPSAVSSDHEPPARPEEVRAAHIAIERASRRIPGSTCLARACALHWMLRRRGIAAAVRLGVRTDAGALRAHAWVEYQDVALDDPRTVEHYATLK